MKKIIISAVSICCLCSALAFARMEVLANQQEYALQFSTVGNASVMTARVFHGKNALKECQNKETQMTKEIIDNGWPTSVWCKNLSNPG